MYTVHIKVDQQAQYSSYGTNKTRGRIDTDEYGGPSERHLGPGCAPVKANACAFIAHFTLRAWQSLYDARDQPQGKRTGD